MHSPADSTAPDDGAATATPCRVAVAGLGRAGLAHAMAAAQHEGCAVAGFVEPRADLRRFARAAGFTAPAEPTLARLLARGPLDALVVCAPGEARAALAAEGLSAGLDVLVDGLPAFGAAGAAGLAALPADVRARLGCASPALFHPLLRRGIELFASGALGVPHQVRASVFVSRVFAPGAPPAELDVLDFAVGDLLLLLDRCLGSVRSVTASAHRLYGARVDELHAMLSLDNGAEAGLDASWSVPGYPRAALVLEVEGDLGTMIASDDALEADLTVAGGGFDEGVTRLSLADVPDPLAFDAGDASHAFDAFVRARESGERCPDLDGERAMRVLRTLDALRASLAAGGAIAPVNA